MAESHCCLKSCNAVFGKDSERAEVKSFTQDGVLPSQLTVSWGPCGEATFHRKCWKKLLKAAAGEGSLKLSGTEQEMVNEAAKTVEYHYSEDMIAQEGQRVAEMLQTAKYAISFTGAGISTSAGIGDFRGRSGKWTENDRKKAYGARAKQGSDRGFSYESLRPTYTHEALAYLVKQGLVKHVISQNCDGLHELSGIPSHQLWELHGNVFHERCEDCGARYSRPHYASTHIRTTHRVEPKPCPGCRHNHRTGRKCERKGCNGYLMNTVINFGDNLESHVLDGAIDAARRNDLVLCLGTSLRVSPANSLVEMGSPLRLVICNRQTTPCDELCFHMKDGQQLGSRVYGDCDRLMQYVMSHLLSPQELEAWEEGREARLDGYAAKRTA